MLAAAAGCWVGVRACAPRFPVCLGVLLMLSQFEDRAAARMLRGGGEAHGSCADSALARARALDPPKPVSTYNGEYEGELRLVSPPPSPCTGSGVSRWLPHVSHLSLLAYIPLW